MTADEVGQVDRRHGQPRRRRPARRASGRRSAARSSAAASTCRSAARSRCRCWRRSTLPTLTPNCELRNRSTVAPQSLLLMNSEFVARRRREHFAERVDAEAGDDPRGAGSAAPGGWRFGQRADRRARSQARWRSSPRSSKSSPRDAGQADKPLPPARSRQRAGQLLPGAVRARTRSCTWIDDAAWTDADLDPLLPAAHFLAQQAHGHRLAGAGLAAERRTSCCAAPAKPTLEQPTFDLTPKRRRAAPQARAMISLFMQGGPSHIDLFDPKPELTKRHRQTFPGDIKYDNAAEASAKVLGQPVEVPQHGQCGMELSELLPHLGEVADDITLIRSMHTGVNNHGQSINALQRRPHPPTAGPCSARWLTYGLGSESQNLPAYVVLTDPTGLPVLGVDNWSNGWLPSLYQGTVVRPQEPRILNLDPPPHDHGRGRRSGSSSYLAAAEPRAPGRSGPASTTWRPASPATSWPPGCRPPPRRRSTSRRRRPRRTGSTASTSRRRRTAARAA